MVDGGGDHRCLSITSCFLLGLEPSRKQVVLSRAFSSTLSGILTSFLALSGEPNHIFGHLWRLAESLIVEYYALPSREFASLILARKLVTATNTDIKCQVKQYMYKKPPVARYAKASYKGTNRHFFPLEIHETVDAGLFKEDI